MTITAGKRNGNNPVTYKAITIKETADFFKTMVNHAKAENTIIDICINGDTFAHITPKGRFIYD